MKTVLPLLLIFTISVSLYAQKDDDYYEPRRDYEREQTLFNSVKVRGAFAASIFEYNYIGDDFEVAGGFAGALAFNHLFAGVYGMGTVQESFFEDDDIDQIEMAHGGFWLGYTLEQHKLLHLYSSVKVGWGALNIDLEDETLDDVDAIFVVTPEVGLELNILRCFKLAGTVGYRWVDGVNEAVSAIESDALDGVVTTLTLRFGFFGRKRR